MRSRLLGPLVFTVGAASLGGEIAAARLLAPWFGASTIVWANTIATVLLALSIGYWLGGRLADRDPRLEGLCRLALVASLLLAVVPFVADPFLSISVEALDGISAGAFVGSLIAVLVLVAVPVLLLGAVAPWAIRLSVATVEEAGRVAGRLYALSTIGSLVGTFLSALLLIPLVGTQRTFLCFALALAVVAVVGLRPRLRVVPVLVALLLLVPAGTTKANSSLGKVIHERDTEYQYARVVEDEDGRRLLELNEGRAVHSVYDPATVLTDNVWDGYLVLPFASLERTPKRVAILGNAAGTTVRAYAKLFPQSHIDGVEIDGELTEIGRKYFAMRNPRLRAHTADARPFLRRAADRRYDIVVVDAYRQPYIPFYLATTEFFRLVREKLAPGGVLVVNAGHPAGSKDLEKVLAGTMRSVFPTVLGDPITPTNTLLVAGRTPPTEARLRAMAAQLPGLIQSEARASSRRLRPAARGGRVYTDDHAPVEWLIDASILSYAAEGGR